MIRTQSPYRVYQAADGGDNKTQAIPIAARTSKTPRGGGDKTGTTDTGTRTGSTGSGAGASASTGIDWAAYYQSLSDQANAAADAAYENNMARISDMYNRVAGNIGSNYDSTVGRLDAARNKAMKDVNADAERSLRQAYINSELTKKGLNQRLSAMGYNGGATESTMADLANQYSRSRGGINTTRNSNIADLNETYANNLANALQAYNNAMNNLEMQRIQMETAAENARANGLASGDFGGMTMDSGYIAALQAALQNQGQYQYDPSQATNDYIPGNVQQAQSAAEATNYQKLLEQAKLEAANGGSVQNVLFNAIRNGDIDLNSAYRLMNSIGR